MMYVYGMRLRGFSLGCQPMANFDHVEEDTSGKYHDVLVYRERLSQKDLDDYELDYLGEREEPGSA